MKKCPRCHTPNPDTASFCSNCGYGVPVPSAIPVKAAKPIPMQAKIVLGSIIGLIVVLGLISESINPKTEKPAANIAALSNSPATENTQSATQTATPTPTATPAPTLAELKTKTDELLKLNIDNYEFADFTLFDRQMELLRAVPKESKDYPQAQAMLKKLINKVAPVAASIALLGEKPKSSEYDGRVEPVVKYLKATMNDYEDSEWIEWSQVVKLKVKGEPFWGVRLKLRGKNAFGAKILKNMLFLIRNNQVVATEDLPP